MAQGREMIKRVAVAALIVAACFLFVSVVSVLEFVRDVVEGTRVAMIAIRLENCDNDQACIEALRRDLGCDPDKDCFEGLHPLLRTLATPEPIKDWSLTSLKEKLIKIGAKVVSHGRYVVFQMAEVAIPRQMFQEILRLIAELRPQPPPTPA
jgi:hypothetical protein